MAYIPRDEKAEDLQDISIYALCSPNKQKAFIWKTLSRNLKSVYKDHVNHHCAATSDMVTAAESENLLPQMYLLEQVYTTHQRAYNHCVAWARHFKSHGYDIIPMKGIQTYADSLSSTQNEIYVQIEQIPLAEVCAPSKNLFPAYRSGKKCRQIDTSPSNKRYFLSIPVSAAELQAIKCAAEASRKSQSAYCRERILCGSTVHIDYSSTLDTYHAILDCRKKINQTMQRIYVQGGYDVRDLAMLQRIADTILLRANEMYSSFTTTSKIIMQQNKAGSQEVSE